jgi:Na+/melibiose symporter and related transporters
LESNRKPIESETSGIAQNLTWHQLIIYASFTMPITIIGIPLTVYLPPLYGELGVDLALMGFILLVARFSDVITDPIIGITSDKSVTRIGRRKPWL